MILVRIDHEEPYYADQAARTLRTEGATVDIDPALQETIETEWDWADHPMHWLNRNEIRQVSDEAQRIHDDITSGRLTIHLHAHDGWTIVAVGTYRDGRSVHLHGENHLRVIAAVYDNPAKAIVDFARLNGDSVRTGPAPATDTERDAAELLATTTRTPAINTAESLPPAQSPARLVPVYTGDPGDHEALLSDFLGSQGEWEKYRTWSDETTHVIHESQTLRIERVHETPAHETAWTVAAYETPVSDRM